MGKLILDNENLVFNIPTNLVFERRGESESNSFEALEKLVNLDQETVV
jgi:hypothetical protein